MKHRNEFLLLLTFVFGVAIGFFVWDYITLPFNNPWNIQGILERNKFSPYNNIFRYIVFITIPSLLLILINYWRDSTLFEARRIQNSDINTANKNAEQNSDGKKYFLSKIDTKFIKSGIILISFLYCVIWSLFIPTYHSSGDFDSFHEGESLGTSISLLNSRVPYKEVIFAHGIFQDPMRSIVSFKLFKKSIGSARTLESIIKVLTFVLLLALLLILFDFNLIYTLSSFIILMDLIGYNLIIIPSRDIVTFTFVMSSVLFIKVLFKKNTTNLKINVFLFFLSLFPFLSFAYSIDRGFYISASFLFLMLFSYLFVFQKNQIKYFIVSSFLGTSSGILILGYLLEWEFSSFINFVFLTMPMYKELMDGMIYPIWEPKCVIAILVIALNTFWITYKALQLSVHKPVNETIITFCKVYFIEIFLLFTSIIFFRSALGRSGLEHIAYSSILSYILSLYIIFKHYIYKVFLNSRIKQAFIFCILFSIIITSFSMINDIHINSKLDENFPVHKEDSFFIPKYYLNIIDFLRNNLTESEYFLSLDLEASWYYFVNKPCPTKFPIIFFAQPPFYQEEIIRDLKSKDVKYIIYCEGSLDNIPIRERLPQLYSFIRNNYEYFRTLDEREIWTKKKKVSAEKGSVDSVGHVQKNLQFRMNKAIQ